MCRKFLKLQRHILVYPLFFVVSICTIPFFSDCSLSNASPESARGDTSSLVVADTGTNTPFGDFNLKINRDSVKKELVAASSSREGKNLNEKYVDSAVASDTAAAGLFTRRTGRLSALFFGFIKKAASRWQLSDVVNIVRHNAFGILFITVSLVVIIFSIRFYRDKYEGRRFMTTTRLSIMDKEVQRACRYIEDNFADPLLGRQAICAALITGEAFIEALFEKELGLTIEEFISQVRINRAKIQMRQSQQFDAGNIAHAVGYRDMNEFLATFSRITGVDFPTYCSSLINSRDG